mgnify:FL=1
MTSAILFALGDTLSRLLPMPDVTDEFAKALASEGFEDAEDEASRIIETFRERLTAGYARGDLLETSVADVVHPFIGPDARSRKLAATLDHLLGEADIERWEPPSGRDEVLEAIRGRGLKVGFVSNTLTSPAQMRRRLEEFGLLDHAEVAVFSVEQGVRKPNPEIYRAALRALAVEPGETIFVGDRVREDVRGPQSVGMHGVLTHEFRQDEVGDATPLAVISRLADLLQVLDRA